MCATLMLGALLGSGLARPAFGDSPTSAAAEQTLSGLITGVDQKDKTVLVKSFWKTRTINLAADCRIVIAENSGVSSADLREGQKVQVRYENANGVPIAHRIELECETFSGVVQSVDSDKHAITVRRHMLDKTFQIADACRVVLPADKSGRLADVRPGYRVTVTYEIPKGNETVFQIALTSRTFTGSLTAIDLNERTLKAKTFGGTKRFNLANDCRIVIGGSPDGKLSDLRIGDKVVFSYEDINGVLVADRVGRESETETSEGPQAGASTDASGLHVNAQ